MREKPIVVATCDAAMPVRLDIIREVLGDAAEVRSYPLPYQFSAQQAKRISADLKDAAALLIRTGNLTAAVLEQLPNLRCAVAHGTGYDQIDVRTATQRQVWVSHVPTGNVQDVAEFALAQILNLLRHIPAAQETLRHQGTWDGARQVGRRLADCTVGILGYGHTGRRVAAACRALGAEVLVSRRQTGREANDGVQFVTRHDLFERADILSIHIPLNNLTRGLINADVLAKMKRGACLVNTARGGIIDQTALTQALQSGHLAGAALDVFDPEPPDFNHPLFSMPQVWITPHMAGSTDACLRDIARTAAEDIGRVLAGQSPRYPVNKIDIIPTIH